MILSTSSQVFLAGLAGGAVLELLHWYAVRRDAEFPIYARSARYWVISGLMAVAGGGVAFLYFGDRADGIVAFHVGLSTPLILQKLTTSLAFQPGARGGNKSILDFFRW